MLEFDCVKLLPANELQQKQKLNQHIDETVALRITFIQKFKQDCSYQGEFLNVPTAF